MNADTVLNHVSKAVTAATKDSESRLYSKTVSKYENQVVSAMKDLAVSLSTILGKNVTITVDGDSEFNSYQVVQDRVKVEKSSVKAVKVQNDRIKQLEDRVQSLEKSLDTVVSQNNTTIQMMASLSQYLTSEVASVPKEKKYVKSSDCNANISKKTVSKDGVVNVVSDKHDVKSDKPKRKIQSDKKSKQGCFEGSSIRKVFHKYYENEANAFYRVLDRLAHTSDVPGSVSCVADAVLPWFDCRFISKKAPKDKQGKSTYKLYQFPRYLAYYVGVCAHRWNNYKLYNVASDLDEFVESVKTSEHENPMPAPNFLIAKSNEHVELEDVDVVRGYSLWLTFVEWFNKMSKNFGEGVTLEAEFFTAKMKALGYGSESLLAKLQDIKDSSNIDYEQYKKTGTL